MNTAKSREFLELEAYAREHGYIVKDSKDGRHYVYKRGPPLPVADCLSHWDAVRVAYDLAKAFPATEG